MLKREMGSSVRRGACFLLCGVRVRASYALILREEATLNTVSVKADAIPVPGSRIAIGNRKATGGYSTYVLRVVHVRAIFAYTTAVHC